MGDDVVSDREIQRAQRQLADSAKRMEIDHAVSGRTDERRSKMAFGRVSAEVHTVLYDARNGAKVGRVLQELGEWMIREKLTLDQARAFLLEFYAEIEAAENLSENP